MRLILKTVSICRLSSLFIDLKPTLHDYGFFAIFYKVYCNHFPIINVYNRDELHFLIEYNNLFDKFILLSGKDLS